MKIAIALASLLVAACVPQVVVRDYDASCRVAASALREPMSATNLVEVSAPFPRILADAITAYNARIAGIVLTSLGAAGLVGAFVEGFATDTAQEPARAILFADIGVTLALGVGALVAGKMHLSARARAVHELDRLTREVCPN